MTIEFNETELRRLDLNLLLVFAAVVKERSVTRAAAKLFVGPPAISMALGRLRAVFGDPLFVRAGGVMEPTGRALALYERIAPALADIATTVRGAEAFDPSTSDRIFRFASPDDLELVLIPALLLRLAQVAPRVRLVVRSADFRHVPALLHANEIDLALTAKPDDLNKSLHWVRLHREHFAVLFDPRTTPLPKTIRLDRYVSIPHVFLSTRGDRRGPIDDELARLGRERDVLVSVPRFSTAPFILKSRPSLINMPSTAARHFARAFDLAVRDLPFKSPEFDLGLISHVRSDGDAATTWFVGQVSQIVAEICGSHRRTRRSADKDD